MKKLLKIGIIVGCIALAITNPLLAIVLFFIFIVR